MKIVSANYFDRDSSQKWLIRDENERHLDAKPFDAIVATGVTFGPSDSFENGRGCSVVARCESANGFTADVAPKHEASEERTPLHFRTWCFVDDQGREVIGCRELHLDPDGSIHAFEPQLRTQRSRVRA